MSIGTYNLASGFAMVGLFLLALVAIAAIVAWVARRRGSRTVVVDVALTLSAMWVLFGVIALPFALVGTLTGETVLVTDVPISASWPEPSAEEAPANAGGATLESGALRSADLWVAGLSFPARAALAAGQLLAGTLTILPAAVIAIICFQLLRGRPFAGVAARALSIAGGIVLVAGIGVDLAFAIGRTLTASEVLPPAGSGEVTSTGLFNLSVQLWPIGAALALVTLGAVFRHGTRLQRETDLLV